MLKNLKMFLYLFVLTSLHFKLNHSQIMYINGNNSTIVPLTYQNGPSLDSSMDEVKQNSDSFFTPKTFKNFYKNQLLKVPAIADGDVETKQLVVKNIVTRIEICYDRFRRCATELSPSFCGGTGHNYSFYIWARQWANFILQNSGSHRNVKCSEGLLKAFSKTIYGRVS